MKTLSEFETNIGAAEAAREIDTLLEIDLEIRRICWAARARCSARELANRAAQSAANLAGETVQRYPEFAGSDDGRTRPVRVPGLPHQARPRST